MFRCRNTTSKLCPAIRREPERDIFCPKILPHVHSECCASKHSLEVKIWPGGTFSLIESNDCAEYLMFIDHKPLITPYGNCRLHNPEKPPLRWCKRITCRQFQPAIATSFLRYSISSCDAASGRIAVFYGWILGELENCE